MGYLFGAPWWLVLALPIAAWVWASARREDVRLAERRWRYRLIFRACTFLALILGLADLRWPGETRAVQLAAVYDLSASVYDRNAASLAQADLVAAVEEADPEMAVVVFGLAPGQERAMAKLPPRASRPRTRNEAMPPADPDRPPLPDLLAPRAVLDAQASDYGAAIDFARGQFPAKQDLLPARAIVLVGDGLDTQGRADLAVAALNGSGIDLLAMPPAAVGGYDDVRVDRVLLPDRVQLGRGMNIEATVAGQKPTEVTVRVGRWMNGKGTPVGSQKIRLAETGEQGGGCRATVRIADRPEELGVAQYKVTVEVPPGLSDLTSNNALYGAVRVEGPRRWAVLTRPNSMLARWIKSRPRVLGADADLFLAPVFPTSAQAYRSYAGVLADGLSAKELPPDSAALRALTEAMQSGPEGERSGLRGGLGLVALGGDAAFGAGGHPLEGTWENLLPVTFRPEEDRTRTILFLVDVSSSMSQKMARGDLKIGFAKEQLGLIVRPGDAGSALQATDRVGLVAFSGSAKVIAPVSSDPTRKGFIDALGRLAIDRQTSLLAALDKARELLEQDQSEERLVVMLSDGEDTAGASDEELTKAVETLCPAPEGGGRRRTSFYAFGIGIDARDTNEKGAERLKRMAKLGGGAFYPEFLEFANRLREVFDEGRKDLYTRSEPFHVKVRPHPAIAPAGEAWPELPFRNRVKARASSEAVVQSVPSKGASSQAGTRLPDPVVTVGRLGASRTAVLALTMEGEAGMALLSPGEGWKGGQALLAGVMSWAEGRDLGTEGWRVEAEPSGGGRMRITLYAEDPKSGQPRNGLKPNARLTPLIEGATPVRDGDASSERSAALLPEAPGRYAAELSAGREGVYTLEVRDANGLSHEQFVTVPYPEEFRRFGADRNVLGAWAERAGGTSRLINQPNRDLKDWLAKQGRRRSYLSLRPALLLLAAVFFLCEIAARGMRARRA